jgi:hypothetical protein
MTSSTIMQTKMHVVKINLEYKEDFEKAKRSKVILKVGW